MSLNFGGSKQDASSQSNSYGYNSAVSQDNSASSSVSSGQSTSGTSVFNADAFTKLFGGASGAAQQALLNAPELTAAARQLFTGGNQFLQSLGGGAGTDYMTQRLSSENPVLQQQIDALRQDTGRLFTDELNPAITSRAVAGGTLGGGRQGVAQGLAASEAERRFTEGATALRAADVASRDQVAAQVAQNSLSAASTGLGALPGLLDVMERGNNESLGIYGSLSSILGGPTTLSQSQSSQSSVAESLAQAFSRSFGEQRSTSSSRSRGRAFNFGVGLTGGGGGEG